MPQPTPTPTEGTIILGGAATPQAMDTASGRLPVGTRLHEFEITGLIGEGGFGIVYLAEDHSLHRRVALKEYMPAPLATRGADASVQVRSRQHADTFRTGLRSFINEARLLAQFDHPALVKVYRFWEANGTAYMAMPFYAGQTLRAALGQRPQPPDEAWIRQLLPPIMDALELMHRQHCCHRDIAPDNIMLLPDQRPVLLDLGAARRVIGDLTHALTVILKPGYAPIEQYAEMPGIEQGAWTDVYALGAVVHFMITGHPPPPSVGRLMQDAYEPLAEVTAGRYSEALLRGIDRCLAVKSADRPQSIADMRALIGLDPAAPAAAARPAPLQETKETKRRHHALYATAAGVAVAAWAGLMLHPDEPAATPSAATARAASPDAPAPASAPAAARAPVTLESAFAAAVEASAAGFNLSLSGVESPLRIGRDKLSFTLRSDRSGWLQILLWDQASGHVSLIFPNANDREHRIAAGQPIAFPRAAWHYEADEPAGDWAILAIVSEAPRDFAALGLAEQAGILTATQDGIEAALNSAEADRLTLAGTPSCRDDTACSPRYAALRFTVRESATAAPQSPARLSGGTRPAS